MSELLSQEQLTTDLDFVNYHYDGEPDKSAGFDAACHRIRKHIETQQHMITAAVSSLKPFMDNNPSDEQVLKYLQEYAHLIATVPPVQDSELLNDPNLWKFPKFED